MANKIEILALIDRSGSMTHIIDEAVAAFNTFIQAQRDLGLKDKVRVTLASFDNQYEVVFDRVKLSKVPELTVDMVKPRGMTALHDSIAKLVNDAKHPKRDTILLIQTDGAENSSSEFTGQMVRDLIAQKEADGWDVNFIGAGIDAMVGTSLGFSKSISVSANAVGMAEFQSYMTQETVNYRAEKIKAT